jgi:hypothetical protein
MKVRHNNTVRRWSLVTKRLRSLSRKSLKLLEESILDEDAKTSDRLDSAKAVLEFNLMLEEVDNIAPYCALENNG